MKWNNIMKSTKPCKKLIGFCGGTSSGRNNAGRITIFHRGGGSKRLQRKIDLKRSTSSMGIVERIEYDPNRSSKIALVRWVEGVQQVSQRRDNFGAAPSHDVITKPITDKIAGQFTLAGLTPPRLMAGNLVIDKSSKNSTGDNSGKKLSSVKDVFVSAFSSSAGRAEAKSLNIPRVAVAGAKPEFFSPKMREATGGPGEGKSYCLADVRKWKKDSILWEHRLKRKAAVSWQSFVRDEDLELDRNAESDLRRQKKQLGSLALSARQKGRGLMDGNRVPLTYILASHELKPGQIVMNCDWSKSSTRKKLA